MLYDASLSSLCHCNPFFFHSTLVSLQVLSCLPGTGFLDRTSAASGLPLLHSAIASNSPYFSCSRSTLSAVSWSHTPSRSQCCDFNSSILVWSLPHICTAYIFYILWSHWHFSISHLNVLFKVPDGIAPSLAASSITLCPSYQPSVGSKFLLAKLNRSHSRCYSWEWLACLVFLSLSTKPPFRI